VNFPERLAGASLTSLGEQAVVTPHLLASRAATLILDAGGNAVDAAITANAVLGVVAPETCGVGGDLFALVHVRGHASPAALNSSGHAGEGARSTTIRANGFRDIPIDSPYAVTVPGCVDGWIALSERFGTRALADLLAPAIDHAGAGFPASPELASALSRWSDRLQPQPAAEGLYPGGSAPDAGDTVGRPALATVLTAIGARGRDGFYGGTVADAIVLATDETVTYNDLDRQQAEWVEPISLDTLGWTGWTIPPNSQGYLTIAASWLFEHLGPSADPGDPDFIHATIEAYRAVAWERDNLVADARYAPLAGVELLNPERLAERLQSIGLKSRARWPAPSPAPGGTAYLCVRDRRGMGVSLIQSNYHGIGSRIGAGNTGFFLHDRGSGFNLTPGHPNEIGPGKRPLHTLSPTLWTEDGELRMILGTRGGDFQPQTLLQVLTYLRRAGMDPASAQRQPRWATREWRAEDATVVVEPGFDSGTITELERRGHRIDVATGPMAGWGPVSVIVDDGKAATGAADPRVATTAAL